MSYTKGPWSFEDERFGLLVRGSGREEIANVIKWYGSNPYQVDEYTANASLISAAPCLYEALDKMLDHFEGSIPLFLFEMAEGAIAKAKGVEQ